mmetsp:Transcript_23601/g.48120  ORF Transcript_23601/g.48120 Transcript_23601/m.48120 type:complete len:96 (+) Transcript_23601:55-342(+)
MFDTIQHFVCLYSWEDQHDDNYKDWLENAKNNYCYVNHLGRMHCHWRSYFHSWDDDFWGDSMKLCNEVDETGCNGFPTGRSRDDLASHGHASIGS